MENRSKLFLTFLIILTVMILFGIWLLSGYNSYFAEIASALHEDSGEEESYLNGGVWFLVVMVAVVVDMIAVFFGFVLLFWLVACILGWIAFVRKACGLALAAAIVYLIPSGLFTFSVPLAAIMIGNGILGIMGANRQKK